MGASTVTVTGTSGTVTSTTMVALTVSLPPSFTIAAAPSMVSVVQGSTVTSTITLTGMNGFSSGATLAATGLPTGVTATYGTNPVTGTSVVTFTATAAAPAGTTTVTITGTSGTLTASTTVAVTVVLAPSFTITPASATLAVVQGGTMVTDVLTIKGANGFAGAVTLAATGLPSGVTATFSANPVAATSTVQLTASSAATLGGPVTVTITGTSGTTVGSTTIALTVNPPPSFTLAATPATVTVAQTTSITTIVMVTNIGGFAGTPTLVATGLPTGITATFTPYTAVSQQLTLTASATAGATSSTSVPPYSGTITITGTSGTLTSSTSVGLTIIGAPSFVITGTPLVVKAGAQVLNTTPLSLVATNGFAGTVALTCAVTPTAASHPATCSIAPGSVTLAGTTAQAATLTINTTGGELVQNHITPFFLVTRGGTALAFVFFLVLPRKRRIRIAGLLLLAFGVLTLGLSGCADTPNYSTASSGTTVGAYTGHHYRYRRDDRCHWCRKPVYPVKQGTQHAKNPPAPCSADFLFVVLWLVFCTGWIVSVAQS